MKHARLMSGLTAAFVTLGAAACGSPGLYAEEYDVAERQLRGNLPQAFVHAMVLECAARLAAPWHSL